MKRKYLLSILLFCLFSISACCQTVLQGKVTDNDGFVIGAALQLFFDDEQLQVVASDFDGNYLFIVEKPGKYAIQVTSIGNQAMRIEEISVCENATTKVDVNLDTVKGLEGKVTIMDYKVPLVDYDMCCCVGRVATTSLKTQIAAIAPPLTQDLHRLNPDMNFYNDEYLPIAPFTLQPIIDYELLSKENDDNNIQVRIPPKSKLDSLTIYPNPVATNNTFKIKTSSEFDEFQLYAMNGQLVAHSKFEANTEMELIAPDAAGIYIIRLLFEDDGLIAIGRIIVIR